MSAMAKKFRIGVDVGGTNVKVALVDKNGSVKSGKYTPEDNLNCKDGKYAKHCGGGNTGRIGIAVCCMKNSQTPPT